MPRRRRTSWGRSSIQPVAERWDARFYALETREEVRAYCRHNFIPLERADIAKVPLWLTKRGALVRARK
jgi:hypothetical protein